MREIVSPLSGIRSPFGARRNPLAAYAAAGFTPKLVAAFADEFYAKEGRKSTFGGVLEPTATTNATMVDSDGLLKWRPHNSLSYSNDVNNGWSLNHFASTTDNLLIPATSTNYHYIAQSASSAVYDFTWEFEAKPEGYNFVRLFNAIIGIGVDIDLANKTFSNKNAELEDPIITDATDGYVHVQCQYIGTRTNKTFALQPMPSALGTSQFAGDGTSGVRVRKMRLYRSDLGGMVNNPDTGDSYVPTTTSALYLPRRNHHVYNGSEWVSEGVLIEPETRTNLLLNSGSLSTQSVTVSANPHTLHFTGTGSITLSGAHSATLSGTGTGEENRVRLTFTPSAGTLVLTVSGTVTNGQLEEGSTPSSLIPTNGSQVARAAEQIVIPHENISWPAGDELSIHLKFLSTYSDDGGSFLPLYWVSGSNSIQYYIDTAAGTGQVKCFQFGPLASGGLTSGVSVYSPGVNVPMNIASRHAASSFNIAVDGSTGTGSIANTGFPDLETADLQLAYTGGSMILQEVSLWDVGIGDAGTEDATDD